jgi:hypothetical protein
MLPAIRSYLGQHHLAFVALFVALGGVAVAAPVALVTKLNQKKVTKIARSVADSEIAAKAPGLSVANATNAGNADTLDSLDSTAFGYGVLMGRIASIPTTATVEYASANGNSTAIASFMDVEQVWPAAAGVARNFKVLLKNGISTGTLLFELQRGGTGGPTLPCGPITAGQFQCVSPAGQTLSIPSATNVWIRISATGTPDDPNGSFGIQVTEP